MARPSKNSCDYFPHDNGMRNHVKIKAIRNKFEKGYSIWVMFLEFLTGSDGNVFEYNDLQFELLSGDFGVSATEIKDVIDYALKLELIFNENGFILSESLNERLAPVYLKRGKSKELSSKQKRLNGKFAASNTDSTVVSVTEIPQSKVKEIKEDEKENIPFSFRKSLIDFGVEKTLVSEWLEVRKYKKLRNTETAFKAIQKEIYKSNLTPTECIKIAVEKSWGGFETKWIKNTENGTHQQINFGSSKRVDQNDTSIFRTRLPKL